MTVTPSAQASPQAHRSSPFLRSRQGVGYHPLPDLHECIDELLAATTTSEEIEAYLVGRIGDCAKRLGDQAPTQDTWFRLLLELNRALREDAALGFDLREFLSELRSNASPREAWTKARRVLLDNLFSLLENQVRARSRLALGESVVRHASGKYFIERDGVATTQIQGLKTLAEEVRAYLELETKSRYGRIFNLVSFCALYFTALDFKALPSAYPAADSCFLPESDAESGFLRWQWHRQEPYQWRSCDWRPENCLCDRRWLGEDVLAAYAVEHPIGVPQHPTHPPDDHAHQLWEEVFGTATRQLEVALDTDLIIDDGQEAYFEFEGRRVRWLNGTGAIAPTVVMPLLDGMTGELEIERVRRFLSQVSHSASAGISELGHMESRKRYRPILQQPRLRGGLVVSHSSFRERSGLSDAQATALAYHREALSSHSKLYAFLNFYKILELASEVAGLTTVDWIHAYLIPRHVWGLEEWMAIHVPSGTEAAEVLRHANRDAIAHASESGLLRDHSTPIINPDNRGGLTLVISSERVVRDLAKLAMDQLLA